MYTANLNCHVFGRIIAVAIARHPKGVSCGKKQHCFTMHNERTLHMIGKYCLSMEDQILKARKYWLLIKSKLPSPSKTENIINFLT